MGGRGLFLLHVCASEGERVMDIIERLDAAIKTEDFWVGDQRKDNILKDSKKIIEQLRNDNNRLACLAIDNAKDTGRALMYRKILQQIADEGSGHGQALAYAALKEKE
jgi:hypothetical protein